MACLDGAFAGGRTVRRNLHRVFLEFHMGISDAFIVHRAGDPSRSGSRCRLSAGSTAAKNNLPEKPGDT
jgi:hypothetical protein